MLIKQFEIQTEEYFLIQEFLKNPFGPHSIRLQKIMNMLRGSDLRLGLLCRKPFQEWVLITLHGSQKPIEIHEDCIFTNLVDAEIEIFRRRWMYTTGTDPLKYRSLPC